MARAKRTDRAEARRRYRQTAAEAAAVDEAMDEGPEATGRPAAPRPNTLARSTAAPSAPALPQGRVSVMDAMRWSVQPANVRADLAALPWLVTRTKAIWVPALLTVASAAAFLVLGPQENAIALLAFQAFVVPPPMAASFLSGLLAPRAAWLAGGITGLIAALVYAVVAFAYPAGSGTAGAPADPAARQSAALFALMISPTIGLAVGAFAGFYRRFLRAANPNPQNKAKSQRRPTKRSTARR